MNRIAALFCTLILAGCGADSVMDVGENIRNGKVKNGQTIEFEGEITKVNDTEFSKSIFLMDGKDDELLHSAIAMVMDNVYGYAVGQKIKAECTVMQYESDEKSAMVMVNQCSVRK